VYQEAVNLPLPRTADAQAQQGQPIKGKLQPGDLVFFQEPKAKKITHVGIVSHTAGEEVYFIHASTSKGVREDLLSDPHWKKRYVGARRLLRPDAKAALHTGQQGK
jgi:cell wall-associated NlpC family hydrolase